MAIETTQVTRASGDGSFVVNCCPAINCWRLVHDGKKVRSFFESDGVTTSRFTIFAGTKEECLAEIVRLGLEYDDDEI